MPVDSCASGGAAAAAVAGEVEGITATEEGSPGCCQGRGTGLRREVEVLDSVIAQQRMAASAHCRPSVPFLPLLLGAKSATHTKFASSSSSDDDEEEEEENSTVESEEEEGEEEEEEEEEDQEDDERKETQCFLAGSGSNLTCPPSTSMTYPRSWLAGLNPSQRRAASRFIAEIGSGSGGGGQRHSSDGSGSTGLRQDSLCRCVASCPRERHRRGRQPQPRLRLPRPRRRRRRW